MREGAVLHRPPESREGERGSALLIVFVFAAILAITLYTELPVVAFEAQRQKEQLVIDRGGEYARAVKLYVRKVGHYPSSIKDLEETNRMRFLRKAYVDPLTGKNDWRLLHAGPGGMLVDSKVKGNGSLAGVPGGFPGSQTTGAGSSSNTGSSFNNSSFNSSSFGNSGQNRNSGTFGVPSGSAAFPASNDSADAQSASSAETLPDGVTPAIPQVRRRGPAVRNNGAAAAAPAGENGAVNPDQQGQGEIAGNGDPQVSAAVGMVPDSRENGNGQQGQTSGAGVAPRDQGNGGPGLTGLKAAMLGNSSFGGQSGARGGNQQNGLNTTLNSGGLAGVASKASGKTIKTVNEQKNYSLWEFFYDPRKDVVPGGNGSGNFSQGQGSNAMSNAGSSGFNQASGTNQPSAFGGSSSFGQSSFGSNTSGAFRGTNSGSSFGNNSPGANQQPSGGEPSSQTNSGGEPDPSQTQPQQPQ